MNTRMYSALVTGLLALPVFADQQVDRTLDAAAESYVEVSNTSGSTRITGWSQNKVRVQGTLGDKVEELIFERDGDDIVIKVKVPRNNRGDIDADLVISIPEQSSIDVSGVSADIEVDGVLGEQSIATVSGDVVTKGVASDVEAASVSGDVEVSGTGQDAETEAATVSGDVSLSNLAGGVEAESVSGDVSLVGGSFERVGLESVNGDITYKAALRSGGRLSMESVNGTVELELTEKVSARIDIETFNGSIKNCFGPKPERTSRYSPGLELSFTEGDGDGRIEIETLNGSVRLCQP